MRRFLVSLGIMVAIVLPGLFALAVFAPPETSVFRPSEPAKANELIRSVKVDGVPYSYPLYFVEFDDEGFYADPGQKTAVLDAVKENIDKETGESKGTIILLYVHGLNHNAREEDDNVSCFAELLDATAMMQGPRKVNVVGVYVGWPGLVYDNSYLNAAVAYLGREAAADRIAERGDLLDLFTNVSRARHESGSKDTRFVIIGHSLGGRAAYMALRPIMQRFIDESATSGLKRTADVTVFANPAFSAVEHSTLQRIMSAAAPDSNAIPRFIVLTSESDEVLSGPFQVSQKLTSFFRGDYGLNNSLRWTAAGHHLPYLTHDLRVEHDLRPEEEEKAKREGTGLCPRLSANELGISKGMDRGQNDKELYNFAVIEHNANDTTAYKTTLRRVSGRTSGEAMVIQVDKKIIPNHNDIFTTPSVDFIARVLNCGYDEAYCMTQLANLDEIDLIPEDGRTAQ